MLIYISDTARLRRVITDLLHQYRVRPDPLAPSAVAFTSSIYTCSSDDVTEEVGRPDWALAGGGCCVM